MNTQCNNCTIKFESVEVHCTQCTHSYSTFQTSGCAVTRLAAIIDPVYEKVSRDVKMVNELDLKLKYAMNTHCHADHVTGMIYLTTSI